MKNPPSSAAATSFPTTIPLTTAVASYTASPVAAAAAACAPPLSPATTAAGAAVGAAPLRCIDSDAQRELSRHCHFRAGVVRRCAAAVAGIDMSVASPFVWNRSLQMLLS